jgi:hypothetical protein
LEIKKKKNKKVEIKSGIKEGKKRKKKKKKKKKKKDKKYDTASTRRSRRAILPTERAWDIFSLDWGNAIYI